MDDMLDGNFGGSCAIDVQIDLVWLKAGFTCKMMNAELVEQLISLSGFSISVSMCVPVSISISIDLCI